MSNTFETGKLPKLIYECTPFVYIAIAGIALYARPDSLVSQVVFALLSSWALMVLFMRRAFRRNGGVLPTPKLPK